ncbi:CAP-associated domain-containing protein [Terrilactibacillus sp. S3-3]|nr:CAP-associated domain-containing protein [Terrilactibacillus sp. S3-3]
MTSHKTNIVIFFIAVIVFAATFIFSLTGMPAKEKILSNNQHRLAADRSTVSPGFKVPDTGISTYLGKSQEAITTKFGKPERMDPTQYGYHWLIYGRGTESYLQIGIDDQTGKVTTIYALGKKLKTAPFVIEKHSREIYKKVPLSDTVSLDYKKTKIEFEFNEEDLMMRPLIKFGRNWVQLNFDHMKDRLIGVRYMTPGVLSGSTRIQ